jgi:riboflavin synthase
MFTGIVQHLGRVTETSRSAGGLRLAVDAGPLAAETKTGDSVCVIGVCLTVTDRAGDVLRFDVIGETLSLSTLGDLRRGAPVNLELSLRPADRLGGHFVTGHVDGVATVRDRRETPGEVRMSFACDGALTRQMIAKGSVAVDGVSLTLTEVGQGFFEVALIPHTLSVTTLGSRRSGDRVNLETDLLGKWVLKALGKSDGLTESFLREHGFA